jgi:hypothetical protein
VNAYAATLKRRGLYSLVGKAVLTPTDRRMLRQAKHAASRKHYATGE